ncbi:SusC/RagA family TonB-linked outer membrane protein [Pseudobacter ginsenosidimutans]|uniref:TonB-linked SusC/RagA family outer membrane protein n=1 Tax=Pseudobacter ginsenosidimutans TaxID=661488 RepID=A0A4Q7N4F1_9BACT|nr:SusC/RagA family TonB-linked outer membrane protein [Pseudobacter ginsenosidimutans]QEC44415.1 SusC/RagA family TonB-linked outer membrane protein [Pseudobacter ginsenosidimutans]RZS75886.1 TonB-linked SusC/RagA family outer membrane protein [Pseudobacter ginsenosidimutans]
MKRLLLVFTCLLSVLFAVAQTRSISGIVKDDKGDPVAAATVRAKGARSGTTTKGDGSFTLTIPQTAQTLVVSSVGFTEQEIPLTPALTYDITLQKSSGQELSEVVVTAQGISRDRRSLGYATTNLKTDQIANKGEVNLVNSLQGKVAGVNITGASGSPGASSNINIRGITSFLGSNQPLFVVDGVPVSNDLDRTNGGPISSLGDAQPSNRIADLNLNNIESVNVLKGPAAAVLYGSRASNGAIIITTKKGAGGRGKMDISLGSSYSIQKVSGLPELQNEYGQGLNGVYNPISGNSFGPKFGATPTTANGLIDAQGNTVPYQLYKDNIKDFFETGNLNENNLNINFGDATQNATLNIGHLSQHGIIPATSLKRTNIQFGGNTTVGKMKIGGTVTYINTGNQGALGGNSAGGGTGFGYLVNIPRSFDLQAYENDWKFPNGQQKFALLANGIENPYFTAHENPVTGNLSRFLGSATLSYDITPWLNATYRFGADVYTDRRKQIYAVSSRVIPQGLVLEDQFYRQELNSDLFVTAKKKDIFTEGLNATAMLGWGVNQRKFQNVFAQGDELVINNFYNLSSATVFSNGTGETHSLRRLVGYYGQISLDWNNYLFLELTGRVDQSSTLPKNKNTYLYPGGALSFVFTDAFDISNDVLSYGKLRFSAAQVGRDADPYQLQNIFVNNSLGNNVAGVTFPLAVGAKPLPGFTPSNIIRNPDIKPEFTTSYEVGVNLGLFKNRVTIDAAYFNTVSKDQIFQVALPASTGFTARFANVGKMTNKGIELALTGSPFNGKNFQWDINANFTRIRNKVVDIFEGVENFAIASGQSFSGVVPSIAKGYAYGVVIGNKLPRTPDGQFIINPLTGTFAAGIGNSILSDPNPDWTAGITNTFRFHGISLQFLWDYTSGGDIFSFTVPALRSSGALKETGVNRDQPMIIPGVIEDPAGSGKYVQNTIQIPAQAYWRAAGLATDLSVFDATVLRLRELALGYDLPANVLQKTPLSLVRFTAFARNLWFHAPNYPMDPEVNTQGAGNLRGLDLMGAPNVKTMGISLKVTFK